MLLVRTLRQSSSQEARHRIDQSTVAGLILAAGEATRLGEPKAAAVAHGKTFAAHVASALQQGGLSRILAVVGIHETASASAFGAIAGVECLQIGHPERGPIASLCLGLERLSQSTSCTGVVVAPVDHPDIQAATITCVLEAAAGSSRPIVVPCHTGKRGHPTYFAREVWPEFAAPDLHEGARSVVRRDETRVLEVEVPDHGILRNIDTPTSLARWQQTEPRRTPAGPAKAQRD